MTIFEWVRTWTGGFLMFGSIVLMFFVLVCGIVYLVSMTYPDEPELDIATGEYGESKSETRAEIWNIFKALFFIYPTVYALGVLLGSTIVAGFNLLTYDKVKFK